MSLSVDKPYLVWFDIYGFNIEIISGLFTLLFLCLLGSRQRFLAAALSVVIVAIHTCLILLSTAVDNGDGLPDQKTLEAMQGHTLLRTDRKG